MLQQGWYNKYGYSKIGKIFCITQFCKLKNSSLSVSHFIGMILNKCLEYYL